MDLLIIDVDDEGWPLTPDSLEDLRWYLEDYLDAPYGVYEDRGAQIQRNLKDWGEAVFTAALGPVWAAFRELTTVDAAPDVVIRSASPALLALPWELMRDPGRPAPVALDLGGMSRAIGTTDLAKGIDVPGGRLRVLMVISRPKGVRDVGYQMIARPLIARLAAVRGDVDLVVLRPPTLDALTEHGLEHEVGNEAQNEDDRDDREGCLRVRPYAACRPQGIAQPGGLGLQAPRR